jgi:hypothetical protein
MHRQTDRQTDKYCRQANRQKAKRVRGKNANKHKSEGRQTYR